MKIFAANMPFDFGDEAVAELFQIFGEVNSVKMITENNGKRKGFGFVEMEDERAGLMAIKELDGININGRDIIVKLADGQ